MLKNKFDHAEVSSFFKKKIHPKRPRAGLSGSGRPLARTFAGLACRTKKKKKENREKGEKRGRAV